MITNFVSTRRVQTELLIHHPIHANDQFPVQAQAPAPAAALASAPGGELEKDEAKSQAENKIAPAGKDKDEKSTTEGKWSLTSLSLAISSHILGQTTGQATFADAFHWRISFYSLAILLTAFLACTCRIIGMYLLTWKWLKSSSCNTRNQYIHRGRVIYEWSQTPSTITFYTKLPSGQTQDSLEVKLWPSHARIGRTGKVPFLKEALYSSIDVDKCSWSVSRKGELVIILAKEAEQEWPCVFATHHPDKAACERMRSEKQQRSQIRMPQ
jgi:hypothetical protein